MEPDIDMQLLFDELREKLFRILSVKAADVTLSFSVVEGDGMPSVIARLGMQCQPDGLVSLRYDDFATVCTPIGVSFFAKHASAGTAMHGLYLFNGSKAVAVSLYMNTSGTLQPSSENSDEPRRMIDLGEQ